MKPLKWLLHAFCRALEAASAFLTLHPFFAAFISLANGVVSLVSAYGNYRSGSTVHAVALVIAGLLFLKGFASEVDVIVSRI